MGTSFLEAVLWNNLNYSHLYQETFEDFSYGDAEYTLVSPLEIIYELTRLDDAGLGPLIRELETYNDSKTLIAFSG